MSRDEMAGALVEVAEGRVPKDRIALKCLHDDMLNWPFLEVRARGSARGPRPTHCLHALVPRAPQT